MCQALLVIATFESFRKLNLVYTLVFQPCDVSSHQLMSCLTPEVVVPEAFQRWDFGLISTENRTRRRRSQERFDHSSPNKHEDILHDENHLAHRYRRSVQQEADQTLIAEKMKFFISTLVSNWMECSPTKTSVIPKTWSTMLNSPMSLRSPKFQRLNFSHSFHILE